MTYRRALLDSMVAGERLPWYENFAHFFPVASPNGKDLVAKVFDSSVEAKNEYENLCYLHGLDPRLRVPEPLEYISLGRGS